jgi:hypothetical protein
VFWVFSNRFFISHSTPNRFGIQFGILEAEAKVNLPAESSAYLFFGTYMVRFDAGLTRSNKN